MKLLRERVRLRAPARAAGGHVPAHAARRDGGAARAVQPLSRAAGAVSADPGRVTRLRPSPMSLAARANDEQVGVGGEERPIASSGRRRQPRRRLRGVRRRRRSGRARPFISAPAWPGAVASTAVRGSASMGERGRDSASPVRRRVDGGRPGSVGAFRSPFVGATTISSGRRPRSALGASDDPQREPRAGDVARPRRPRRNGEPTAASASVIPNDAVAVIATTSDTRRFQRAAGGRGRARRRGRRAARACERLPLAGHGNANENALYTSGCSVRSCFVGPRQTENESTTGITQRDEHDPDSCSKSRGTHQPRTRSPPELREVRGEPPGRRATQPSASSTQARPRPEQPVRSPAAAARCRRARTPPG